MNPPGVIIQESPYSVKDTIGRIQEFLQNMAQPLTPGSISKPKFKKPGWI